MLSPVLGSYIQGRAIEHISFTKNAKSSIRRVNLRFLLNKNAKSFFDELDDLLLVVGLFVPAFEDVDGVRDMHPHIADAGRHVQPKGVKPELVAGGQEEDTGEHAEEVEDHVPIAEAGALVALLTEVHRVMQDEGRCLISRQLGSVAVALRNGVHHHHHYLQRKESEKSQNKAWLKTVPPEQNHRIRSRIGDPVEDLPEVTHLVVFPCHNTINIVEDNAGHHEGSCSLRMAGKEVNSDVEQEEPGPCDKLRLVRQDFLQGFWLTEFHIKYIINLRQIKARFRTRLSLTPSSVSTKPWLPLTRPKSPPFESKQSLLASI